MDRKFWLSLAATLLPLPVVYLGTHMLLPGLDPFALGPGRMPEIDPWSPPAGWTLFGLGLSPAVFAFLLVELAAFALPAYRPLRHTREGRWKLRRAAHFTTFPVALLFAALTAQSLMPLIDGGVGLVLVLASLTGGVFLLLALAELVERRGLASGVFSVFVATALTSVLDVASGSSDPSWRSVGPHDPWSPSLMIGAALAVAAATIFVLRRPITTVPGAFLGLDDRPRIVLRAPLSGILPLTAGILVASVTTAFLPGPADDPRTFLMSTTGVLLAAAVSAILLAFLFQPPSRIQRIWERALGPFKKKKKTDSPEPITGERARAPRDVYAPPAVDAPPSNPLAVPFAKALLATFAYLGALFLVVIALEWLTSVRLSALASTAGATAPVVGFTQVSAFALDAYETARFVAEHGPCASVRVEVRPYAADLAVQLLARKAIPAHARSRHTATLFQIVPFAPMYILVPLAQAKLATYILDGALGPAGSPPDHAPVLRRARRSPDKKAPSGAPEDTPAGEEDPRRAVEPSSPGR